MTCSYRLGGAVDHLYDPTNPVDRPGVTTSTSTRRPGFSSAGRVPDESAGPGGGAREAMRLGITRGEIHEAAPTRRVNGSTWRRAPRHQSKLNPPFAGLRETGSWSMRHGCHQPTMVADFR